MNTLDLQNRIETRDEQGFTVYVLGNEHLELEVVPELGARIISLRNLRSGREWMWHPAHGRKLFRNQVGDDFARSTLIGWDECLPTIAPCIWQGRALPDHGEVWSVPWAVDALTWQEGRLRTTVRLSVTPFELERTIELRGGEVLIGYQLRNLSVEDELYIWAMHPLLQFQDGDQIHLPASTQSRLVNGKWLGEVQAIVPDNDCSKGFARPVRCGYAGVCNVHTGDYLEFGWDPKQNDTLGMWLTRGGWHGHHHLALEPTNGADDALSVASEGGRCGIVDASSSVAWNVRVRIGP